MRLSLVLFLLLCACSSKPPAPEITILPCYKAKTYKEFARLSRQRAKKADAPLLMNGQQYGCIDTALPTEEMCYTAKNRKEYEKLSVAQDKQPAWPIKIGKKYYRCILESESH